MPTSRTVYTIPIDNPWLPCVLLQRVCLHTEEGQVVGEVTAILAAPQGIVLEVTV